MIRIKDLLRHLPPRAEVSTVRSGTMVEVYMQPAVPMETFNRQVDRIRDVVRGLARVEVSEAGRLFYLHLNQGVEVEQFWDT